MEFLTTHSAPASYRRARLHDRDYWVVPMTLIVEGVLDGSQGPLFYPKEELSSDVEAWNGMPLVGYHPTSGAGPVSARSPEVLEVQQLGTTFAARFLEDQGRPRLQAEGWFDLELVRKFDRSLPARNRILPRLESSTPIELSTGLFLKKETAPSGAAHNGRPYVGTARHFRPDHVAVLPDAVGACSIRDGCGVLINHQRLEGDPMPLTPDQKKSAVDFLMTNCACWKKPGDQAILNGLPDDKLQELRDQAEAALPRPAPPADPLLTPDKVKQLADLLRPHLISNPAPVPPSAPPSGYPASVLPPAPTSPSGGPTPTYTPAGVPVAPPVTANQWLDSAPSEIKTMLEGWKRMESDQKRGLADRLVANVQDVVQKQATHALLMNKTLDELRLMVSLLPVENLRSSLPALFSMAPGAVPAPSAGSGYDPVNGTDDDLLIAPTINWSEGRPPAVSDRQPKAG